jgi:MtfA peptidase
VPSGTSGSRAGRELHDFRIAVSESQLSLALIVSMGALAIVGVLAGRVLRARRRAARFREPFPAQWRLLLEQALPLYRRMPRQLRLQLEPSARAFLADVQVEGCRDLEVTDEMRLVVAIQACLLVVARDPGAYALLRSVLIYPDEFIVSESDEDEAGVVTEGESVLSGQSLDTSRIVLSWADICAGSAADDVYNVVLHEFAHFLDNAVAGTLTDTGSRRAAFEEWHDLLEREYQALCAAVDRGEDPLIDPYGTESTAEFFAVATETFFEAPLELRRLHPALYAGLQSFYGLDPAGW